MSRYGNVNCLRPGPFITAIEREPQHSFAGSTSRVNKSRGETARFGIVADQQIGNFCHPKNIDLAHKTGARSVR